MPRSKGGSTELTTPDLVLLSLLTERAMHGYQANQELERRQVRDWAGISRPQVYYSLEKLLRLELVREAESSEPEAGPERRVLATNARGKQALARALGGADWTTERSRPAFLTWMALSWMADGATFAVQLRRRGEFLETELARAQATLRAVRKEVGHRYHEAVWMLSLTIDQFRTELRWLRKISREAARRAAAKHPAVVEG